MSETSAAAFLELVAGRRGHFRLESGHHSGLWLDLDPLFAEPHRVNPFVATLATALRPYGVAAVETWRDKPAATPPGVFL